MLNAKGTNGLMLWEAGVTILRSALLALCNSGVGVALHTNRYLCLKSVVVLILEVSMCEDAMTASWDVAERAYE